MMFTGLKAKLLALGMALAAAGIILLKAFSLGKASAALDAARAADRQRKENAKIAASVDAMSGDVARDRLSKRWSRD